MKANENVSLVITCSRLAQDVCLKRSWEGMDGGGVHLALLYPPTSSAPQTLIKCKFNNASLIPLYPGVQLPLGRSSY